MTQAIPGVTTTPTPTSLTNQSANLGQDDFLQLLVAQLQNQDPMNPMDQKDSMAEMAQFSTLQQITTLVSQNQQQGFDTEVSQSVGLIGKSITYLRADGTAGAGIATSVSVRSGEVDIQVGADSITPDQIVSVSAPQ